jgi:sulfatase modifying factor 1
MVRVDLGTAAFCIDSTEVTRKQYVAFLDSGPSTGTQPANCAWNTTFTPSLGTVDLTDDNAPMVKVDWCDALAFCTWAGKRLCGAIQGGGPLSTADGTDPAKSEWMAACTRNGSRPFPYGQTSNVGWCNTNTSGPAHVGTFPSCEGGYPGIFDMVGNITEWTNECDGVTPSGGSCNNRGGTYATGDTTSCSYASADDMTGTAADWGFRCCAD